MGKRKLDEGFTALDLVSSSSSACQQALPKRITRQAAQDIRSFEQISPCFLGAFPRRNRSQRRANCKNEISKQKRKLDTQRRANCKNEIPKQQRKLDTNVFQCYLENLWRDFSEDKKTTFTYLDCLWFALYKKGPTRTKVLMWIKNKHIFSKKYVFVPIVCWSHWSFLIFCHFGESLQSKTRTPCMLLLDSLEMANPKRLEPDIRKFVLDIHKADGRPENKELISRIPLLVPKVPQQRNEVDCGIFVLYFINLFMESAPENFSISEGYPYFMKKNWFSPEGLESFSKKVQSLCR